VVGFNKHVARCVIMARSYNHQAVEARIRGDQDAFNLALSQRNGWLDDARNHFANARISGAIAPLKVA
jgi:hypothetical protein